MNSRWLERVIRYTDVPGNIILDYVRERPKGSILLLINPFTHKPQTALFKCPVRTAL